MIVKAKPASNAGSGCLIAFGGIFFVVGIGALLAAQPVSLIVGAVFTLVGGGIMSAGLAPIVRGMKVSHPEAYLSSDLLRLGEPFTFRLHQVFKGELTLDGGEVKFLMRESATYTRGTDTYTDTHEVVQRTVGVPGRVFRAGENLRIEETFQVPVSGMHTFRGNKNKIEWLVKVELRYARWPDVKEEYAVFVLPERKEAA